MVIKKNNLKFLITLSIVFLFSLSRLFAFSYYYQSISLEDKDLYDRIYSALINNEKTIINIFSDFDHISDIYYMVLKDNPQIYNVTNKLNFSSTIYSNDIVENELQFDYKNLTNLEINSINIELENIKETILNRVKHMSKYEVAKYCYEYLILNSYYDARYDDQSIISVLINHTGVCTSYAKSYKYLMDYFDIPCILVEGTFTQSNESHVWNMIQLDNNWYHVDVTQGDASNQFVDYSYFCITDSQVYKDHILSKKNIVYSATSLKYNYLYKNGCYFDSFDKGKIEKVIEKELDKKINPILLGFEKSKDYLIAKNYLIDESALYKIFLKRGYVLDSLNFQANDNNDTLIFILKDNMTKLNIIYYDFFSEDQLDKDIKEASRKNNNINLVFKNLKDYIKAKKYLIDDKNIFNILEKKKSINFKYYDEINRMDILL